jgi:hypothetical protein
MQKGEIQIYKTSKDIEIQVKPDRDTIWLDARLMAVLFHVKRPAIVKHIQNIYKSGELDETSTCSKMEQVASDGKIRKMNLYNLHVINYSNGATDKLIISYPSQPMGYYTWL